MNDIHALSGPYAIDAVSASERADFEQHLAECPACQAEVDSLREAAALLPSTSQVTPSPALRDAVLAGIATVRPLPPLVAHGPAPVDAATEHHGTVVPMRRRRPSKTLRTALVAAAAAAVIGGVGAGVVVQQLDDPQSVPTAQPTGAEAVLAAADVEVFHAAGDLPEGTTATVHYSEDLGEAVISTKGMPAAPVGDTYQLWYSHDGEMVPAGLMSGGKDQTILLEGDGSGAEAVGVTVEPEGGSQEPSLPAVALFPLGDA